MTKKNEAYSSVYAYKSKSKTKNVSFAERRKLIGKHLSFGASEAYKLLRTNLIFSLADDRECKIVGVTSALPGEGKSLTSMNLSYSLAQNNKRVLLIEGDMRIPVIATTLKIENSKGLSNVLAGVNTLQESVQPSGLIQNLYILPAGDIPPNPSELLSSKRMEQVLEALSHSYEYIIIDLPPVNAVSDGLAIAGLLSGMLMVVRQDYCDQQALAEAMRRMELLQVKVLGFVMNYTDSPEKQYKSYRHGYYGRKRGYGYGYRYGRGYGYGYGYGYGKKVNSAPFAVDSDSAAAVQYPAEDTGDSGKNV